jgi:phenylpropionate dioxygenase-like ring-hydroxylating dioxygenase large terminal subunit
MLSFGGLPNGGLLMPHFPKPPEGSWTEHYPQLGTGPVTYEDSIDPEFFELERKAIFARTWLNVGRIEQLPRVGSYFTKEIDAAHTSIVVVRAADQVRAFYNMCRHRGNKLVWQDYPGEETSGTCRQFTCKYHGWRYSLEGDLTFVQQESEFFDLDKADYGLAPVRVETWEGFIFVNLDASDTTPLRDYLGKLAWGLEGYPFDKMTQVYKYRAEVGANWKLFIDAFTEFYHAPVLHARQSVSAESQKLQGYGFEALSYQIDGPHGMVSSWGGMSPPKDLDMVKPIERVLHSGLFGPWERPIEIELPPSVNPARSPAWGIDSFLFFPNFMLLVWAPNWYLTYHYWPTSYNTHIFEGTLYFVPPRNARERLQQELAAVTFKEYSLQDGNTLEATQTMLESRAVTQFPLGDQEILLRLLHVTAREYVADYQRRQETAPQPQPVAIKS